MNSLTRFLTAQAPVYEQVKQELAAGRKTTHWMWFIFPQIKGLGYSSTAKYYAISSLEEAKAYWEHPVLGSRLIECCQIILGLRNKSIDEIFGHLDAIKLRSSATLFALATNNNPIFVEVLNTYYNGLFDESTHKILSRMNNTTRFPLLGSIAGDIIGSVYERNRIKNTNFKLLSSYSRFTDDTVLTIAVADWLSTKNDLTGTIQKYARKYSNAGYGGAFRRWMHADNPQPYNSWGNGSAMRVSPVGWAFDTLEETLEMAKQSAEVTHNHPEGIKGAQATAACIYLARTGKSKQEIKDYIETTFEYNLSRTCDEIRPTYHFDVSCQGSVPESIIAFLESTDFESAIRLTVSLGGDADTMGAITGGIAEAYYKEVPEYIREEVFKRLPDEFIEVMQEFYERFCVKHENQNDENGR